MLDCSKIQKTAQKLQCWQGKLKLKFILTKFNESFEENSQCQACNLSFYRFFIVAPLIKTSQTQCYWRVI